MIIPFFIWFGLVAICLIPSLGGNSTGSLGRVGSRHGGVMEGFMEAGNPTFSGGIDSLEKEPDLGGIKSQMILMPETICMMHAKSICIVLFFHCVSFFIENLMYCRLRPLMRLYGTMESRKRRDF